MSFLKSVLKKFKKFKRISILALVVTMVISLLNAGPTIGADETVNANITFTSQIVEQINGSYIETEDVQSGEPFFLAIGYTISASGETSKYTNCTLTITLPKNVSFIGDTSDISKTAFDSYTLETKLGSQVLSIKANELVPGQTGTLYLKMNFDNMKTPDGSTANFTGMSLTGSVVTGSSSPNINPVSVPNAAITAIANQSWTVNKDIVKQNSQDYSINTIDGKQYYSVDYRLIAAPGTNITDIGNNYGRLNCTYKDEQGNAAKGFMLVDTLPVAPVANGGATNISIYKGSNKTEANKLKEGQDYQLVLNDDGSVKAIRINYASTYSDIKNDYTTSYVPDDAYVLTTYTINANYSYDAYRVLPADEDRLLPYQLDNKAEINYLPLGESTYRKSQDSASINVGWVDDNAPVTDLTVTKYLTVKNDDKFNLEEKFVFDREKQDLYYKYNNARISFGLYKDETCTIPAVDFDGNTVGNMTRLDENGQVIFKNINEGTYYLKEDVSNLPFVGDGVDTANGQTVYRVEIKNENKQAVVYLEGNKVTDGKLDINNINTDNGFGYVAFNKVGTSATSSNSGPLEGVKFKLTNKADSSKVYETVSDKNGLVLFEGIPAGNYIVEEDFTSGEYDKPDKSSFDVTVKANHVNYPEGMEKDSNGIPQLVNSSSKGKLIIYKVDQANEDTKLDGAVFNVYGPYDSEAAAKKAIANNNLINQFTLNGNEESPALNQGYYVYQETKAPASYKLESDYHIVKIETQTLNKVTVKNEALGKLRILKKGALSVNGQETGLQVNIPGASFYIYKNESATELVNDENGNPIVITSTNSVNSEYNSNVVSLPEGTYYLKEFAVPDGYQLSTEVIKVTVSSGNTTTQKIVNKTDQFGYLQVTKRDSKTNEPISNVSFDVYNSNNQLVETITTNSLGMTQTSFLPAGNYYLKEKAGTSLNNYVVKTENIDFTITNNKVTNLEVKNDHLVNYRFKKVSSLNEKTTLSGVEFRLYDSDGTTVIKDKVTSDNNGYVTFENLIPGKTYYYQETKTLPDYTLNNQKIEFTAPAIKDVNNNYMGDGGNIENVPKGQFTITKKQQVLDKTGHVAVDKQFEYYPKLTDNYQADKAAAELNNTYRKLTTSKDKGIGTSEKIDAGTYWVEESNVAGEYSVKDGNPKTVEVKAGDFATTDGSVPNVEFVNELVKGKVAIKKISSTDSKTGVEATFNIYKYVDDATHDYSNDLVIDTLKTGKSGNEVVSKYLEPGNYVLVETTVDDNYVLDAIPHKFTIAAGKTNKDYVTTPIENAKKSTIKIKKTLTWNKKTNNEVVESLAGIRFDIYKAKPVDEVQAGEDFVEYENKKYIKDGNPVDTITSNNDYESSKQLEPGYYYIEEVLTEDQAKYYTKADSQVIELKDDEDAEVTFDNTPKKGKVKLTKISNVNKDTRLNGANFKIYYVVNEGTPDATKQMVVTGKDTKGNYTYKEYWVIDSKITTEIVSGTEIVYDKNGNGTEEDGIGYSVFLEPGKEIVLQETKAPQYYGMTNEWYYVGKIEAQKISEITVENYPLTYPVGDKYDEASNRIDGAVMGLFGTQNGAEEFNGLSEANKENVINNKTLWATYDLLQTAISNKTSGFQFKDVDPTRTYYVLELKAPDKYNLNDTIYKVTVKLNGNAYELIDDKGNKLSIRNYPFQQIWVRKVLEFANEKTNLDGIKFNVYYANDATETTEGAIQVINSEKYVTKGNFVGTYTTGSSTESKGSGSFITTTLPAGIYVIEEDTSDLPAGIKPPQTTSYAVILKTDSPNKDLYDKNVDSDKNIVNKTSYGKLALIKQSSLDKNTYVDATFNIYEKSNEANHDYSKDDVVKTITTNTDGTPVLSDFLKPGNYVLVETSVNDEYVLDATPIDFTIEANKVTGLENEAFEKINDAKNNPFVITNVPKGNINGLVKKGTYLNDGNKVTEALKDVEFEVYSYEEKNGSLVLTKDNLVGTAKSDSDGNLKFYQNNKDVTNKKWLAAGPYVLKETAVGTNNANNGFEASYLGKFEIKAGETTKEIIAIDETGKEIGASTSEIINKSAYGQIKLTKVDHYQKDKKLSGVTFEIRDSNGKVVDTITTGKDGTALSKLLPEGTYTVKETSTLGNYFLNENVYTFTVESLKVTSKDDNGNKEITNVLKQSIEVNKINSKTDKEITNLDGAVFSLWDSKTGGKQIDKIVCNSDTKEIVFTNLQPDTTYYLQEDNPPNGYVIINTERIEIKTTNNGVSGNPTKVVYKLKNEPLGSIKIEKVSKWTIYDLDEEINYPLEGAEFTLYQDVNGNGKLDSGDKMVTTKVSNNQGVVIFDNLKAGNYLVKETKAPDDFTGDDTVYSIQVEAGEENSKYTGNQAIVNIPTKGRFSFTKTKPNGTGLPGATFQLLKEVNGTYQNVFEEFTVDDENGEFLSNIIDPGNYQLKEVKAPDGFEISEPINFTVEVGKVTFVTSPGKDTVINQALGTIKLTKYNDQSSYLNIDNKPLENVEFGLYQENDQLVISKKTDQKGQIIFEDVPAGKYYVKEIKGLTGYQENNQKYPVTVKANQNEVIEYLPEVKDGKNGVIINKSNMGRLVIKKVASDDDKGLSGAVFKISKVNDTSFVPVEITSYKDGLAISDLLPANSTGSKYLVEEIKAPDGYSLDDKYFATKQEVTVYPLQDQEVILSKDNPDGRNYLVFKNYKIANIMDIDQEISKYIDDNGDLIQTKTVNTPLLDSKDVEKFTIRDYADGQNDVPVSKVVVEDTNMQLYYLDANNDYVPVDPSDPYTIDAVTIYHASDKLDNNLKARIYYQGEGSANWQTRDDLVVDVPDANQNIKVELDDLKATKIKVEYYNENGLISEEFKAEGIDLDVTINKRPSDATANEIRQVTNDAKVIYHYSYKDETRTNQNAIYENVTSKVNIFYPLNETTLPKVSLGIVSGEANKIYKPGDSIESTITVINKTETDDPDGTIIQPIISFDLPVGMSLNTNSYTVDDLTGQTTNFQVVVYNEEDATSGILLEPSKYQVVYDLIEAREFIDGKLVNTGKQTRKITILLDEEFAFKPNMKITIKYMGTTSINDTSTVLSTPAYFTSGVTTALSIENPYGNSFTVETSSGSSANTLVDDKTLDEITGRDQIDTTGTGLKYPFSVGEIIINETNYLSIYKQVKGIYNDDWLNYNQIASTAPGEDLDYQIIFKNGGDDNQSDRAISKARVVDILPFAGDSLVNRTDDNYTARSTTLAKSPILRYVDVLKDEKDFNYTLYYCVGNDVSSKFDQWKEEQRTKYTAQEELPIVYNDTWSDDDWNSGKHQWVKASEYTGDLNLVSAFAIEFDFSNDLLEPGEAVTIQIKMAAPEYTTDEIEEVEGKYMANSALIAVQRFGSDTISKSDITENREVKAKLTLPKGTIGDYVWYDLNRNGIQDDSDIPVQGLMVTLHKYVTTYDDEGKLVRLEIFSDDEFTTRSDSYGHYEFTNQDCNVLKSGKTDANSKDPNDYVGDRYYEYRVEFAIPEDESTYTYVPTKRYALDENGKRQNEIDSNIGDDQTKVGDQASDDDEYCFSEYFALTATKLGDASLAGETNLTLDAGFIAKGSLGDYVWFDANKNGIQDPDETGVADVTVRLYQADENGNIIDNQALATTKTDRYGYYLFADLIEGNYIVEFDISDVVPKVGGGYLDRYYFSANNATDDQEYDSNPVIDAANQDTMVARTDLITLEYHSSDMSIDAGLTVYSALSGVVFEDRDYSDIQNYYDEKENEIDTILVPGTIVTLYQVSEEFDIINALPDESWIVGQTTVGEDGKYYFDKLDNGYYVVKFTFPEGYSIASGDVGDDDTIDSDVVNQIETVDNRVSGYTNVIEIGLNEIVSNVDGGVRLYSALGDYVFNDNNSNGIQDEGDSPIAGVTVYLFKRESEDGSWQYYRQTVTDEEGYYLFTNLEGSTYTKIDYRVIFDLGITTKITIPYAGDDQALDSNALNQYIPGFGYPTDPIDLAYNTVDLTWDAGVVQSRGAIGDYVWYDSNVNGIQDEEGTGIGGIKVVLETNTGDITNEDDWQEVAVTYTNEHGYYIFNNLKEGYYRVKFEVPANYNVTLSLQGEDSAIDSDGIYFNDDTYYYTRSFYLDQDGYDMTWDLGVYDPTVTTTTITTTVDSSTDGIMTGDDKVIFGYVILAALSLVTAYGLNRKRKQLIKRQ